MKSIDILAVSPHPDDVELACSGTLIHLIDKGYRAAIVDMTDALLSTTGDPVTRQEEAEAARKIMNIHEHYQLGLKEGSLTASGENLYRMVSLIRRTRPYLILAPYKEDRHPDHSATSQIVQSACFWAGVPKYGDNQAPHRPHRLVNYFLHWEGPVSFVVDISATFDRKLKAIRAYHSQFLAQPGDRSYTYISRPEFLENIINRARYYGSQIGAEYGEPFCTRETQRVDDMMDWANIQGVVG